MTPHVHFWCRPKSFTTTWPPDGGNPSESTGFILRCEIIFYILVLAFKTTANHVSYIASGSMTISVVCRKFDSDNMDFVEIEHSDNWLINQLSVRYWLILDVTVPLMERNNRNNKLLSHYEERFFSEFGRPEKHTSQWQNKYIAVVGWTEFNILLRGFHKLRWVYMSSFL